MNSFSGFYQHEREAWLWRSCQTVIFYFNGKVMIGVITKLNFDIFGFLSLLYVDWLACIGSALFTLSCELVAPAGKAFGHVAVNWRNKCLAVGPCRDKWRS